MMDETKTPTGFEFLEIYNTNIIESRYLSMGKTESKKDLDNDT